MVLRRLKNGIKMLGLKRAKEVYCACTGTVCVPKTCVLLMEISRHQLYIYIR